MPDPGSTSLLAVGLLAVVVLVFLLDSLDEWWTVIVIPVVGALTYRAVAVGHRDVRRAGRTVALSSAPVSAERRPAPRSARC